MNNLTRQQSVILGSALIAIALIWWLHLGWLIWPGALIAGGVVGYMQRRQIGRVTEAVQIGLWMVGLGVLFLIHFLFPGILLLAGASFLLRGHEGQADDRIQDLIYQLRNGRHNSQSLPSQHVPVTSASETERSTTGETTRL